MNLVKRSIIIFTALLMIMSISGCQTWLGKSSKPTEPQTATASPEESKDDNVTLPPVLTPEPTQAPLKTDEDKIREIIDKMTLEEKVAQMLLVRCPEKSADTVMSMYGFGGYILFGRDFKGLTQEEITDNIASYYNSADITPIIAVDEEGGTVCRVSSQKELRNERFKSPRELLEEGGLDAVAEDAGEKSRFLKSFGINVNFAPVADVTTEEGAFMYDRSCGMDTEGTQEYVKEVVSAMEEEGMGSVLKHFPGYGHAEDTHYGIAMDERLLDEIESEDIPPFIEGVEASDGTAAVLVAHIIMPAFDGDSPASLSTQVYDYLRQELGDDIVAVTDDLDMGAIESYCGNDISPAVEAVKAGCDILTLSDYASAMNDILKSVRSGEIDEDRIDESVERILAWKVRLGILE